MREVERNFDGNALGSMANPARTCEEVRALSQAFKEGLYYVTLGSDKVFKTFCNEEGWTLAANIYDTGGTCMRLYPHSHPPPRAQPTTCRTRRRRLRTGSSRRATAFGARRR
jgi:hypothetical protein